MGGAAGGIINKAVLANTPREVLNKRLFLMAILLSFSGGLHGYNTSNIGGVMQMSDFVKTFGFDKLDTVALADIKGWITSALILGGGGGALFSQVVSERFGRRSSLYLAAILYNIGSIMQAANWGNVNQMIAGRAVAGFGSGLGSVVGPMYISEIAPPAIRGGLSAMFNLNIMIGVSLGYWIDYGSLLNISSSSAWQWRVPLIAQLIPGVVLMAGLPFIYESPRWYILHGRVQRATEIFTKITNLPDGHPYLEREIASLQAQAPPMDGDQPLRKTMGYVETFRYIKNDVTLVRRVVIVFMCQIFFNFSGGNSITYYQANILNSIGLTGTNTSFLFSSIYGMFKVIAICIYALFLVDRFGRRPTLLVGSICNVVCLLYITVYLAIAKPSTTGGTTSAAGWFAVVALCLYAIGYAMGWGTATWALNAELFPTTVRGKLMSFMIVVQYMVNFGLTRGFPNMVVSIQAFGPFAIFAAVTTLSTTYIFFALPETKGRNLELMNQLFDKAWYENGLAKHETVQTQIPETPDNEKDVADEKIESKV